MKPEFLIIGGDKRQQYLKKRLEAEFYSVFHIRYPADVSELKKIESYSHIILPVPISKDKRSIYTDDKLDIEINELMRKIKACHIVYGTGFDSKFLDFFEDNSITYYDFMKDKAFKLFNAYLTALGTVRLMLESTDDIITGKKALIIGFGDVAKTLAEKLKALAVDVRIAARNQSQLTNAEFCGYKTMALESIGESISKFDFVFGSVPANILTFNDVINMGEECVYFELASSPYTADSEHFTKAGKKYILASGLPGKFLPKASSDILYDFILKNL